MENDSHQSQFLISEPCTVVVTPRDRFSTIETCLTNIFKNTGGPFEVIASIGGCQAETRKHLEETFKDRVRFIFQPEFRNTAQLRNLTLPLIKTRLAAFLDSDVFVRPNWLEPLIQCQKETGASLVTPLVQDRNNRIHTAGNRFYIVREKGRAYVQMELSYAGLPAAPDNNLERVPTDFAEIHCQLLLVEDAKKLNIYEERLREGHEMDCGLTLKKANRKLFFEPKSRVYLYYTDLIDHPEDVRLFMWKWDMKAMRESFEIFHGKWGLDMDYRGQFTHYLLKVNHRVGFLTKRMPSKFSIQVDRIVRRIMGFIERLV